MRRDSVPSLEDEADFDGVGLWDVEDWRWEDVPLRWVAGVADWRRLFGKVKSAKDGPDHVGFGDRGNDSPPAATGALEHVDAHKDSGPK